MAAHKVTPPHGTRARYGHRDPTIRCRCAECARANTRYQRVYRAIGPASSPTVVRGARQLRLELEVPACDR